ncbi:MAG: carboxypeptidase regulatory-like domain-containing protein, partial [Candidatus Hydrogenedentes bacterium]|nr:carboxypeptidase regulatory-like domain-containing protein [Candidatus Hydrogenedentota bacterium]
AAHVESPKHGQLPESEAPSSPLPGAIPPLSISGHVQDSDTSEGIEGVAVGLASRAELDQGRAPWRSVQTDASGKYEFNGLGPGVFAVRVVSARGFARGALPAQSEAVLTEDGAPPTNFLLRRGITVSGRVLDASNQPVPGARVDAAVREGLKPRNTTDTGPEGEFELYGFDAGNVVLLQAYTETALSAPAGPFELAGPLELTVQLDAPLSVSGAVVDGAGRPLANLVVTARPLPEYWLVTQNRAATDGAGAFTLGELWPGRYAFAIADKSKILYQVISPDEIEVRRDAAGPVTVVVEQPHTLRVSGRVLNPAGKGVPDAAIALLLPDGVAQYTTTDAQGAYMLSGVPEGIHLVEVKHPDFVTLHDQSVRAGDTNVVLTLAPAEALTLRVLDAASGSPIPDFLMLLTEQRFDTLWKAPLERMVPVHAPGGSYQIRLPNAAIATVIIKAAGHALHMADLSPHAGLDLTVRLQSGKSIQGRVIDSRGSPVAGARLYVDHIAPPLEQQTALAVTGVDGLFLLDTLSPDVSLISAAAPGLAPGWSRLKEIDVRRDIIIQLDLPGTVAGQVLVGGHPGANLEVLAVYVDISLPAGIGARTDAEGRFRISALAPGAVALEFRQPSEVGESELLGTTPVIVAADQATPVEVSF